MLVIVITMEVKIYNNTEDEMEITTKDRVVNVTPSTHAAYAFDVLIQ
jgi:hypothetical protein